MPVDRSNATGTYPPSGGTVSGVRGQSPGAPLRAPTNEQDMLRIVTHELGHGLVETSLTPLKDADAPDPTMMTDYGRTIGWTESSPIALFDIGSAAVQSAMAAGNRSADEYQITEDNWNDPRWQEQPISRYMVAEGPHEDFPEAVMAYINEPELLRQRSPRRYAFIEARKTTWLPHLYQLIFDIRQPTPLPSPPMGDFPGPNGDLWTA